MNIGDWLMLQISRFGPTTDDLKTEKPPDEGTTRYVEAGVGDVGERESPPAHLKTQG